jgi:hypothetical protein
MTTSSKTRVSSPEQFVSDDFKQSVVAVQVLWRENELSILNIAIARDS